MKIFTTDTVKDALDIEKKINSAYDSFKSAFVFRKEFAGSFKEASKMGESKAINQSGLWESFGKTEAIIKKLSGVMYDSRPEKKERVLEAEVDSAQAEVSLVLRSMLETRKDGVIQLKKMFPNDPDIQKIEVDFDENIENMLNTLNKDLTMSEKDEKNDNKDMK